MVHRMNSVDELPTPEKSCGKKVTVKKESAYSSDETHGSLSKRPKIDISEEDDGVEATKYNLLEEPSPLGLKLKKSPSFLDLIQMTLHQERSASLAKILARKEKGCDKLKASNFPATLLKIGTWKYKSRYESDLVAKCYFAKHKLVWEVLDGGLKNKIEIQWSDIMAIKANYPDNEPGTLDVVLARQPLFFREINPQPRKHTLWQATSDFTCGQATLHRQHFLQFPQGTLGKHFEKLIQCDPRLSYLSQQPEIDLDTPYFQPTVSIFHDQRDPEHVFEMKNAGKFKFLGSRDAVSVSGLSCSDIENQDPVVLPTKKFQGNRPSIPEMSVMEGDISSKNNETYGLRLLNQIKLPGLHASMSVGDLVNHIGECISEQMRSDDPNLSIDEAQKRDILEEITQYLLTDSQTIPISDEKSIMSRVNSLCCLLQKEPTGVPNIQVSCENLQDIDRAHRSCESRTAVESPMVDHETSQPSMSRKDSVGELLLHLPRIASLPQFLNPDDSGFQGR